MAKYLVGIREVYVNTVEVELTEEEESFPNKKIILKRKAQEKAENLDSYMSEYSHTMPKDSWSIEKV